MQKKKKNPHHCTKKYLKFFQVLNVLFLESIHVVPCCLSGESNQGAYSGATKLTWFVGSRGMDGLCGDACLRSVLANTQQY